MSSAVESLNDLKPTSNTSIAKRSTSRVNRSVGVKRPSSNQLVASPIASLNTTISAHVPTCSFQHVGLSSPVQEQRSCYTGLSIGVGSSLLNGLISNHERAVDLLQQTPSANTAQRKLGGVGVLCMGVLQAGGLENLQNAIQSWLSSGSAKLILTIIFIGIGIFVWKNLDRWKEILLTVLGVVLDSLVFFGAPKLSAWLMQIFQ